MINRQLTSAFRSPRIVLRALLSVALLTTACGGQGPDTGGMSGMSGQPSEAAGDHTGHVMAPSQGALQAELRGYRFDPAVTTIPSGAAGRFTFRVVNPSGAAQTQFAVDQTKLLHLYAIRRDLTHFQHVHPEMTTDGTWTTSLNVDSPGPYRVVADFIALDEKGKQVPLALGVDVSVPGDFVATPLPASASTTAVEAYQVELKGNPVASMDRKLAFTITKSGAGVTSLEPYLDAFGHLTAFRAVDLAYSHLHPTGAAAPGGRGGPNLDFSAVLPGSGDYRLFLQFQISGRLQTAAFTIHAT